MKPIKVYVAGKVSPSSFIGSHWREDFCKQLEEKSGMKIINLDPLIGAPSGSEMIFGRNSHLIKISDLVIVNLTDDISVGGSQEMLIAKYFSKPLLGIAQKEGKFVKSSHEIYGRKVVNYVDPYVAVPCDAIVHDISEAAAWMKNKFKDIKPKGIDIIDKSIEHFSKG
jgi:hypothetical protein